MKKMLFVIPDLKGNGAERVVITLANGFLKQGIECHIICFKNFVELDGLPDIKVHTFPMQKYRWIPRIIRGKIVSQIFDKFIMKEIGQPDLVLSNLLPADRIMCHSQLDNVNLVIHNTISLEYELSSPKGKKVFINELSKIYTKKSCNCVSLGVERDFRELFPLHPSVETIYNPIDSEFIKNQSEAYESPYENYIVHVGKFKKAKRHDVLIKAFAQSKSDKKLVMVGQGELKEEMQALAKRLGVKDKIIFAGFLSNPYPIIKSADLMVLSSDFEGFGLVLAEAQVLGVPVISSDCPSGPSEILPDRCLYHVKQPQELAEKLSCEDFSIYKSEIKKQFLANEIVERYLSRGAT